jgi:hypothetical protein
MNAIYLRTQKREDAYKYLVIAYTVFWAMMAMAVGYAP